MGLQIRGDQGKHLFSARVTRELFPGEKLPEQFTAFQPEALVPDALKQPLETRAAGKGRSAVCRGGGASAGLRAGKGGGPGAWARAPRSIRRPRSPSRGGSQRPLRPSPRRLRRRRRPTWVCAERRGPRRSPSPREAFSGRLGEAGGRRGRPDSGVRGSGVREGSGLSRGRAADRGRPVTAEAGDQGPGQRGARPPTPGRSLSCSWRDF